MPEEKDANTAVQESISDKVDAHFDNEASSAEKNEAQDTKDQDTGVDQSKKANLDKEVEDESVPEDKLKKIAEILGDDKEAIDAYIKSKGYHKDPAWQKLLEKSKQALSLDEKTRKDLEEFKTVTSSQGYIEAKMRSQGYKDEAINSELRRMGFDVPEKTVDDVALVLEKLGLNPAQVDENTRATISDIAKVFDILYKDRNSKMLPGELKPLRDGLDEISREAAGVKLTNLMRKTIETEDILDFKSDIEPELHKFLDENKEATQEDIYRHFETLNHRLTIERLRLGKKQVERDEKKVNARSTKESIKIDTGNVPKRQQGQPFGEHLDNLLDHYGVK